MLVAHCRLSATQEYACERKCSELMSLLQALDSVDPGSTEEDSYGGIDPPVAPSSAIIKVDSTIDVRSLVRHSRQGLHGAAPAAQALFLS